MELGTGIHQGEGRRGLKGDGLWVAQDVGRGEERLQLVLCCSTSGGTERLGLGEQTGRRRRSVPTQRVLRRFYADTRKHAVDIAYLLK